MAQVELEQVRLAMLRAMVEQPTQPPIVVLEVTQPLVAR